MRDFMAGVVFRIISSFADRFQPIDLSQANRISHSSRITHHALAKRITHH